MALLPVTRKQLVFIARPYATIDVYKDLAFNFTYLLSCLSYLPN